MLCKEAKRAKDEEAETAYLGLASLRLLPKGNMDMDAQTKKIIGFAAVGLVLYELWKRQQVEAGGPMENIQTNSLSPVPAWGQQLSATMGTTTSMIDDLMSIPQGPGGSGSPSGGVNFFASEDCILPPLLM